MLGRVTVRTDSNLVPDRVATLNDDGTWETTDVGLMDIIAAMELEELTEDFRGLGAPELQTLADVTNGEIEFPADTLPGVEY